MPASDLPASEQTEAIRSADNRIVKLVRSLHQRKFRAEERAFVLEGIRAIEDAVEAGADIRLLLVREGDEHGQDLAERLARSTIATRTIVPGLYDALSETTTPQGAMAIVSIVELPLDERPAPLFLLADRVRDPGNLGTLMRTAAAAGVTAVVLTKGSVDPYNPKVVRSAMGAHFRVPIRWLTDELVIDLEERCPLRVLAESTASLPYDAVDWTQAAVLIVGSEAEGPSEEMRSMATASAGIPLAAGVESLNAAVAGAVMLFEANRQRRRGSARGARARRDAGARSESRPSESADG